ncbi:DsbA family oxidoreductase [Evansella cellulosilytica]|uniref:DSBA oxidoreductase n=1 Tax=Evansella cellulosilytica (strain ATCC 21833 / DSM 2522 / FERM P-1141 / JCM 9156 / N-4) TaxID=649639 RepID=E6TXI6_EVAC2|nr:DsbA family oxidoreductase [Evansella cellulosilytica]ADU28800.1 DSBA oxidoreductase [Evansella cellulosilytica DSM 2522]
MKIEIWSDFVCPFCYIGKRRLEIALDHFSNKHAVDVSFRSFELDRNAAPYSGKSIHEMLAEKYGMSIEDAIKANQGVAEQADSIGLTFQFENMKPTNTFDAHRLAKYAKSQEKEGELTEKLLSAYFTESKNVGDVETLTNIATSVGLDKGTVVEILDNKSSFADDVRADEELAKEYGVSGVPFFLIDEKYAINGAQPLENFIGALEKIWEEEHNKPKIRDLSLTKGNACSDDSC